MGPDHADRVALGQATGEHPGQIGRILQPVVEHTHVRRGGLVPRPEDERRARELRGHLPNGLLGGERVAHDRGRLLTSRDVAK